MGKNNSFCSLGVSISVLHATNRMHPAFPSRHVRSCLSTLRDE